jgi:hypothetical protein
MSSFWRVEAGRLERRWPELDQLRAEYKPSWMQSETEARGSYLPPPPDFASHSPFGGPSWFGLFEAVPEQ